MPCFRPLKGYRSSTVNPSGKRSIVFNIREGFQDLPVTLPCGRCIGCRLERSRQWAIRCVHEASLYESNSFITLTYAPIHLPPSGTLIKKHFQDFMKRLRKSYSEKIRYFHCGEYGESLGRPHYHACLFNLDFADKYLWKQTPGGPLYVSESLNEIWGKGFCVVGDVTFDSAAYVARYITKKITGEPAEAHYNGKLPEYTTMSRRPGIGRGWYEKFRVDTYPSDSVISRQREMKPPKFYDKLFEVDFPLDFAKVKNNRMRTGKELELHPDNSSARLAVRETVQELHLKQSLKRSYENGQN